jgi:hypothetical protein
VSQDLLNANNWWLRIQWTDDTNKVSENLKFHSLLNYLAVRKASLNQPAAVFMFLSRMPISTNQPRYTGSTAWVRVPAVQDFNLLHSVQTDSGTHPVSYPVGTGGSSPGVKWQRHEANISHPCSDEVKKYGDIPPLPHMSSWHSAITLPFYLMGAQLNISLQADVEAVEG